MANTLSLSQQTRLTGFFYLLVVLTGIFSLMYIPSQFIDLEDPARTIANIQAYERLFRLGIVSSCLCYLFFFFLGMSAFQLLKQVSQPAALVMLGLVLCSIPIAVFSVHSLTSILSILNDSRFSPASVNEMEILVMRFLLSYIQGVSMSDLFWSTWLFPLGYLVYKSGFLPKLLGLLLMIGAVSYFLYFMGKIVFPESNIIPKLRTPASVAEITTCFWLLIVGAKRNK